MSGVDPRFYKGGGGVANSKNVERIGLGLQTTLWVQKKININCEINSTSQTLLVYIQVCFFLTEITNHFLFWYFLKTLETVNPPPGSTPECKVNQVNQECKAYSLRLFSGSETTLSYIMAPGSCLVHTHSIPKGYKHNTNWRMCNKTFYYIYDYLVDK